MEKPKARILVSVKADFTFTEESKAQYLQLYAGNYVAVNMQTHEQVKVLVQGGLCYWVGEGHLHFRFTEIGRKVFNKLNRKKITTKNKS